MGSRHYFVGRSCRWGWFSIFFPSSRTREFSACFTTECGNPDTLKSMSTSLNIEDEPACCEHTTGLSVLSWFASTSQLAFLQSREKRLSISWLLERDVFCEQTTTLTVLSWFGFGFGWVGWEPSACRATSEPNSFIQSCSRKSLEEVEVTQILFRKWFLQFPSEQLSGYNKLGVFRKEWWRSIASDRTSILSFEQDWYRPNTQCFDVSSMLYACTVQVAVLPSRCPQDCCVPYP